MQDEPTTTKQPSQEETHGTLEFLGHGLDMVYEAMARPADAEAPRSLRQIAEEHLGTMVAAALEYANVCEAARAKFEKTREMAMQSISAAAEAEKRPDELAGEGD